MNYLVALSGGVDSVVLLDMLATTDHRLIVAHVDHGIRPDSADDARFCEGLAKKYGRPYVSTTLELGENASEEQARDGRYAFLYEQANKHHAEIVTAHHRDDVIGSIAINLKRGTGWRGLAVMNRVGIRRPLLAWPKQRVYDYATKHHLEWVEDATNASDVYLRNRLRADVLSLEAAKTQRVVSLRARQLQLAREIDRETARLSQVFGTRRYPYMQLDEATAIELLRHYVYMQTSYKPTRAQASRVLLAIKTARANTFHDISDGLRIRCNREDFVVDTGSSVVK